jgi:hypothetical protein
MAKSKYQPEMIKKVANWARDGLIDREIAKRLGIGERTLYEWKERYPQFAQALKVSKEDADYQVEDSLYKRANGYEYEEVTMEPLYNPVTGQPILTSDGVPKIAVTKIVKKRVAPDATSAIFWLKNRQPKKWRDKQEIEHSGALGFKKLEDYFSDGPRNNN